eukprot:CAMPEP_0202020866 /NCGR_PEP_ID=MMETSP0905-20130828/45507_1 /ASSEMBLY_ACC=CAM_ASM_000554 /TAXON_ID=420261 /ORGANISM="Thalassiosira antarctica, Strain CCMP982" /LENGTH=233 /DNA_ID=CAMNT_0048582573 /DNA_START=84 /DNA_END=782 /DNA_ORIENTATION=+
MKVNANFRAFAGINFDAAKYIPSPSNGVQRFMLDRIGSEKARATTIVEFQPNSKFPEHEHIGGEEFLVLRGTFKDQHGAFTKGTYVRNPIGSKHTPWVDGDGCTLLVKLLQMSEEDHLKQPLYISIDNKGESTDFGSVLDLYHNNVTGEYVQMCWVDPGMDLPVDDACRNGEELFVYNGSLTMDGEDYSTWGWLRFPVGVSSPKRTLLKAGTEGAQVYRKTGHLTEKAMAMEK